MECALEEKKKTIAHKVMLSSRQGGTITGVRDVSSFDEKEVLLLTDFGRITLKGEKLHVSRLDLEQGEVDVEGRIDSLVYSQKNSGKAAEESGWKRLFR